MQKVLLSSLLILTAVTSGYASDFDSRDWVGNYRVDATQSDTLCNAQASVQVRMDENNLVISSDISGEGLDLILPNINAPKKISTGTDFGPYRDSEQTQANAKSIHYTNKRIEWMMVFPYFDTFDDLKLSRNNDGSLDIKAKKTEDSGNFVGHCHLVRQ